MNDIKIKNHGVLLGERVGDYKAGATVSALPYIVVLESGDWEPLLPSEERQSNDGGDSMSCVTFAQLNTIESQEKKITGAEPNYSDRWIAKMSGTTEEGNYLWKVADTIRKYGLVKEESYPRPAGTWNFSEYHKEIPEPLLSQLKAEGAEWLKKWDVKYESVAFDRVSLMKHIKMAPLTVIIPGHAVMNFRTTAQIINYFDTYAPFKKTVPSVIQAMKVMLYPREVAIPDDHLLADIKFGDTGPQVQRLINALVKVGWTECAAWPPVYDQRLADHVFKFQLANLPRQTWAFWWAVGYYRGKLVDVATRNIINSYLDSKR